MRIDELLRPDFGEYCLSIADYVVHFVFEVGSPEQVLFKKTNDEDALFEAQYRGTPLGGVYSANLHHAHIPGGQQHLHIFAKQNMIAALNRDGTAHDRSHGVQLPKRVLDGIRQKFPQFTIPPDGLIEGADAVIDSRYGSLLNEMTE